MGEEQQSESMKLRVARTLKWNVIDKFGSQLLYLVTGIVLANVLSKPDFGLAAAVMVFQGFAQLFVDSGFSHALIQKKNPTETDYSTVFWFNIAMSAVLYVVMFVGAPVVAWCFEDDQRLIPLTRVMFVALVLNATSIVQTNRLMKRMEVKMVAVSNTVGLVAGALTGVGMALTGWGAWSLVWQAIVVAGAKSAVLWLCTSWRPSFRFSFAALKSIFKVGSGIMGSAFLNVIFQNIYSFFIGNRAGLVPLAYYTQGDKWSKMPVASISAVLTSSFLPALSQYQDDADKFASSTAKMNRFAAYLLFPALGLLMVMVTPIFHVLFGDKWDASIALFQLLTLRGVFVVLSALYNNYIVALGRSKLMLVTEIVRDVTALVAIVATLPFLSKTLPDDPTYGMRIFVFGQVVAAVLAWGVSLVVAARLSGRSRMSYLLDLAPYAVEASAVCAVVAFLARFIENPWILCVAQGSIGVLLYMAVNAVLKSRIQKDAIDYFMYKYRRK